MKQEPASVQFRPLTGSVLMGHLPEPIRGWNRVAAYPLQNSIQQPSDTSTVYAHYRQGKLVVVLMIADLGNLDPIGVAHFDAPPPPFTDASGTLTFRREGDLWVQEKAFKEPYDQEVVPRFSYKMLMDDEARPLTPGTAFLIRTTLPNGFMVAVQGPQDASLALLNQIFAAVDLKRLSAIPNDTGRPMAEAVAPTPTLSERLQALVPASFGTWTRAALKSGRPGPDGVTKPVAEAEFRRAESRAWMTVAHSTMPTPVPAPGAPTELRGSEGSERFYAEGTSAVSETVRSADGRVDVALMRADGVVVTLWGLNVTPAELKALALAVAPLPPR